MSRYIVGTRCTVEVFAGQFCDLPRAKGMPFPICFEHAMRVYSTMTDMVRVFSEGDMVLSTKTAEAVVDNMVEQLRARTNTSQHRVYYVRVGELIKIGTTSRLKQRLAAYPPNSELLALEIGGTQLEAQRHRQFHHLLAERKEWFRPGPDLLDHIATLAPAV